MSLQMRFNKDREQKQLNAHLAELDKWANGLIQTYFGSVIAEQAKSSSEANLSEDYLLLFTQSLTNKEEPDANELTLFLEDSRKKTNLGQSEFVEALYEAFLDDTSPQGDLGLDRVLLTNIVAALYQLLLAIPTKIHSPMNKFNDAVESQMVATLQKIEKRLRRPLGLDIQKYGLDSQIARMIYEISKETSAIKLPLKSLVNAPLTGNELKSLYARQDSEQEDRLARQILHGAGVILITGYRGVGKSTFVNKALYKLKEEYASQQTIYPHWHVVPVYISLAKATNIPSVLRYCIRTLHNLFLQNSELSNLLRPEEQNLLKTAYIRVTHRYALQQAESTANAVQTQASLKVALGDLMKTPLPLPAVEGNVSRAWSSKIDQTISLLDYDEDQAERDISAFIESVAETRSPSWLKEQRETRSIARRFFRPKQFSNGTLPVNYPDAVRIKLVFVFDEMDKMDEDEGQMPLVRQLKNLFLNRHAVFLLLTSKGFYYRWLRERQEEDSVLNSYFSSVMMVPMFTTEDTLQLLRNISKVPLKDENDPPFLLPFAQYLTYRAMGIPREILRELYEMQQWLDNSLQPYLTNNSAQFSIVTLYAKIQQILEELDEQSTQLAQQEEIDQARTIDIGNDSEVDWQEQNLDGQDTQLAVEMNINHERLKLNAGLREQIRHGRYVLVEQLLADGQLDWGPALLQDKDNRLAQLYKNNWGLTSAQDFLDQVKRTAVKFEAISINLNDYSMLKPDEFEPVQLFQWANIDEGINRWIVDKRFYDITGRSRNQPELSLENRSAILDKTLSDEEIVNYLSSTLAHRKDVLAYLALQENYPDNPAIQEALYDIFTSQEIEEDDRIKAGKKLNGTAFLQFAKKKHLESSLRDEANQVVFRLVIDLIRAGAEDVETRNTGRRLLETLIRHGSTTQNAPGKLPLDIYTDIVPVLIKVGTTEGSLALVIGNLERSSKIPSALLMLLESLQQNSPDNLLELLVAQDIRGIRETNIRELVAKDPDPIELWSRIMTYKEVSLAQRALPEILSWLAQNSSRRINSAPITEWLNGSSWTSADRKILELAEAKPRVSTYLMQLADSIENNARAKSRIKTQPLATSNQPSENQPQAEEPPAKQPLTPEELRKWKRNRLISTIGLIGLYVIFVSVPINLPADVTITSRLLGRLLEFAYLPLIVFGLVWIVDSFLDAAMWIGIIALLLAGGCFYLLIVVLHHPLTFWGQTILTVINIIGWIWFFALIVDKPT